MNIWVKYLEGIFWYYIFLYATRSFKRLSLTRLWSKCFPGYVGLRYFHTHMHVVDARWSFSTLPECYICRPFDCLLQKRGSCIMTSKLTTLNLFCGHWKLFVCEKSMGLLEYFCFRQDKHGTNTLRVRSACFYLPDWVIQL